MQMRVDNLEHKPSSTIKNVELVHADLQKVLQLLKPAVLESRKKLNEIAPTLAELARQLAEQARKAQAESETIVRKPEEETQEVRQETAKLQTQQRELGGEIKLFNAALRQEG